MIFLRATIRKEIKGGSTMTEKDKIESVSDFIKKVTEHTNTTTTGYDGVSHLKPRVFFRGQIKSHQTNLQAGLFRNSKTEFELTHQYVNMYDRFFRNMSNNGERLAQMQHYGLATRLLDVTSLPLVALYFAVSDSENKDFKPKEAEDGIVFLLYSSQQFNIIKGDQPETNTLLKTPSSDHLEIVSTLALMDTEKQSEINECLKDYNEDFSCILSTYLEQPNSEKISIQELHNHIYGLLGFGSESDCAFLRRKKVELRIDPELSDPKTLDQLICAASDFLRNFRELNETINSDPAIKALYHAIRTDIGDFETNINFLDIQIPFFFEPPINNERINAQHGYFLFEPFFDGVDNHIDYEIGKLQQAFCLPQNSFVIDKFKKKSILDELDKTYGINRHYLFPDYSNGAFYVNGRL